MKILHINSYYYNSNFYKNLYDRQIQYNMDISVFVPTSFSDKILKTNYGSYTKVSKNHNKLDRVFFHIKHRKIYKDLLKKYNVKELSLIHAHSLFSNGYIALKLKQQFDIPYIVAVRNTDVNRFFKQMIHLRKLGIEILVNAEKIVFLSESYRKQILDKYIPNNLKERIAEKTRIIPNGIDDFWFNNFGSYKPINNNHIKLLYIGVVNKNKNILSTMKAIKILRKVNGLNITLTVVGKVQESTIYKKIINTVFVKYLEPVDKSKLVEIYRDHDIFIMPSKRESFGLVYAEAMSQGLPIIYSKGQGFDKQFSEGYVGLSVDSQNVQDIAMKIKEIISGYNEMSINATNNIKKFNWVNITEQYKKLYLDSI